MLATVLHTKVADEMSLKIIRAFVAMRKYISQNLIEQKYINNLVIKNDERLTIVENTLDKLNEKQKVNTMFYKGQIYDAYVVLMEILEKAKKEIIIIDEYAGKELFKMIKSIEKKIIIITSNIDENHKKMYEKQYQNIEIKKDDKFHDRFIIIDRKILYHSGSSFKDLGKRCCCISLIENENMLKQLLNELEI